MNNAQIIRIHMAKLELQTRGWSFTESYDAGAFMVQVSHYEKPTEVFIRPDGTAALANAVAYAECEQAVDDYEVDPIRFAPPVRVERSVPVAAE